MTISRRALLAQALLAGVGLTGLALLGQPGPSIAALVNPTGPTGRRKIALLIGIDRYSPEIQSCGPLRGALQDLELQRQLLQYRFGFAAENIWTLTDQAATWGAVAAALGTLEAQTQSGDIVFVQFSGYGSWVQRGAPELEPTSEPSLVLYDSRVGPIVQELPLVGLRRRLQSLPSESWLLVDAAFEAGQPEPGRSRRFRPGAGRLAPEQEDWLGMTEGRLAPIAQIKTESAGQEQTIGGICCGQLTAAWTKALWGMEDHLGVQISAQSGGHGGRSDDLLSDDLLSDDLLIEWQPPLALLAGRPSLAPVIPGAIGVLEGQHPERAEPGEAIAEKQTEGKQTEDSPAGESSQASFDGPHPRQVTPIPSQTIQTKTAWLGGLPLDLLVANGPGAVLELASRKTALTILSRTGLRITVQSDTPITGPAGLAEKIRLIPRDLPLTIGLDRSLDRLERVDATSAIAPIPLTLVAEEGADLWLSLGPPSPVVPQTLEEEASFALDVSPKVNRTYRLSSPRMVVPVPPLSGAIKTVIQGLIPQFEALRAQKILGLLGPGSPTAPMQSPLQAGLQALATNAGSNSGSNSGPNSDPSRPLALDRSAHLTLSGPHQFWFNNPSDRPHYALLLAWQPTGLLALHWPEGGAALILAPQTQTRSEIWQPKLLGEGRLYSIVSPRPWPQTLASLRQLGLDPKDSFWQPLRQPGPIVAAILNDIQGNGDPGPWHLSLDRWLSWHWRYRAI